MKNHFLLFLIVTLIAVFGVRQSLNFALNGDDWQALYFYLTRFTDFQSHFDIKNFSTGVSNYTFAHIIMGLIYQVFSFDPFSYYFVSMILRTFAAISFYPAIHAATKDQLAAILSSVFFATMFTGIETTNWVFNMNTYISISLFNLFLYFYYLKDFSAFSKRNLLTASVLGLSFIFTQNRMHGLLFIIPLLTLSKLKNFKTTNLISVFVTSAILYLPILTYRFLTRSTNDIVYLNYSIQTLREFPTLVLSILSSVGNAILPDKIYAFFNISEVLKSLLIFAFISLLLFSLFKKAFNSQKYFFSFICLLIPVFFLIIPLTVSGAPGVLPSDHRYLIIPGAYILASFAIFLSELLKSKKQIYKNLSIILITLIISINFISLLRYFDNLSNSGRLDKDATKQYNFIKSQINKPNPDSPVAFLFVTDNPTYLYNAITFGFTYHLMLVDKRFTLDFQKSAFPADNIESLIDVLSGPQSKELYRYGYEPVQIPLKNVYVFSLKNKILTNITLQTREYLEQKLPNLK